ncbi:MAG TPA: hypothetical protein VMW52_01720, partial [Phycisphaerae bacterium]|nr:hypothetical protein [Phycisphaerae bacterium]
PALLDELDRLRELHRENSRTIQEASDELDRLRERVKELAAQARIRTTTLMEWQKASDTWKARAHALGWGKPIFSKPPEDE